MGRGYIVHVYIFAINNVERRVEIVSVASMGKQYTMLRYFRVAIIGEGLKF
jgi:hypothetical protein